MGSLKRDLKRLREAARRSGHLKDERAARPPMSKERALEEFIKRVRLDWEHAPERDRQFASARSLIRLFRVQGILAGMSTEQLLDRMDSWKPPVDRTAIRRAVARATYELEEGMEDRVVDPAWRDSFVAAEELLERIRSLPPRALAQAIVDETDNGKDAGEFYAKHGITDELFNRAVGPDAASLPRQQYKARLTQHLVDFLASEECFVLSQELKVIRDKP